MVRKRSENRPRIKEDGVFWKDIPHSNRRGWLSCLLRSGEAERRAIPRRGDIVLRSTAARSAAQQGASSKGANEKRSESVLKVAGGWKPR